MPAESTGSKQDVAQFY